ncbi:putative membrane channel-forming protein YqfA (hemolysin III family) [Bradyrhizobium sp. JR1.5]|uniref:caspase family protein n=1 Tax=unclassified Bradyrhizobium TaxID=2631580 RepID=UPI00339AA732
MQSTKCALVLGNSSYDGELWLRCPKSDAEQTAAALKRLHFDVTPGIDLKYDQLNALIDNFIGRISKEKPLATVVYYSGHGLQVKDHNFILPIDFQSDDSLNMVSVQQLLDRVARYSNLQIVLLDACRSSMEPREILKGKSIGPVGAKAYNAATYQEARTGLAEMQAPGNTFIAFAAAPGDVAYDGDGLLSPFTEAFLKNVELVDIPVSNLMSRVRQEVYRATAYQQQTWDHSSLTIPFYFNPGSLFLFMGNALAVVALLLAMIPYSISLASPERSWSVIALSSVFPVASLLILMSGSHTVYSRLRGATQGFIEGPLSLRDYSLVSLRKGVVGGFVGSIVPALIMSLVYDRMWTSKFSQGARAWVEGALRGSSAPEPLSLIMAKVSITTTVCGCIFGFLSLFFARVDVSGGKFALSSNRSATRTLFGCGLGGALSGLICAPIVTFYFGTGAGPPAMPELLLPSGIVGTAILVFSIVNFDFERLSASRLGVSLLCVLGAVVVGGAIAAAFLSILYAVGLVGVVFEWLSRNADNTLVLMTGGAAYGLVVGVTLGGVIGLAVILTNHWTGRDVLEAGSNR